MTSIGQMAMQAPHPKHLISFKVRLCPGSLAMCKWVVLLLFRSTHPFISSGMLMLSVSHQAVRVNDNKPKSGLISNLCYYQKFSITFYLIFIDTMEMRGWGDRFEGPPLLRYQYEQDMVPFSWRSKGGRQCWMHYPKIRLRDYSDRLWPCRIEAP